MVSLSLLLRRTHCEVCHRGEYGYRPKPPGSTHTWSNVGKKYKHLYDTISHPDNIRAAYLAAAKGKRSSWGYLNFKEYAEANLLRLERELAEETWHPKPLRQFTIYEPKARLISAPAFADRVVHHALHSVIEPIFDATFLPTSFACRNGLGTHAGIVWIQAQLRRHGYSHYLKTDFKSYFASIDRKILHQQYRKKISCTRTLALMEKITPVEGQGLPIGALTSQLGANVYGNIIDHHLHHNLGATFARYMDDIVVLGHDIGHLREIQREIEEFAVEFMRLRLSRWHVAPVNRGINFLGYRVWPSHKLIRKSSVASAKKKISAYTREADTHALTAFVGSWGGHINWADCHNLKTWLATEYPVQAVMKKTSKPSRDDMLSNLIGDNNHEDQ